MDDVEFWFPPGKNSIVEYRSASRVGNYDFDNNRKRIKVKHLKQSHLVCGFTHSRLCDNEIVSGILITGIATRVGKERMGF